MSYSGHDFKHISLLLADLYDALDRGRPWSLIRMGETELTVLQGIHAPWNYREIYVPTPEVARWLQAQTQMAICEADWVGYQDDRWIPKELDARQMRPTNAIYAWVNFALPIRRGFVERVLRSESLFLVGNPMARWLKEVLQPLGLGEKAEVYTGTTAITDWSQIETMLRIVRCSAARVFLFSMGPWALPLCLAAKRMGRVAIDFGHLPDHNLSGDPACQYRMNTCCPDTPEGTMQHYAHAGAPICLPELGW